MNPKKLAKKRHIKTMKKRRQGRKQWSRDPYRRKSGEQVAYLDGDDGEKLRIYIRGNTIRAGQQWFAE